MILENRMKTARRVEGAIASGEFENFQRPYADSDKTDDLEAVVRTKHLVTVSKLWQ